MAFTTLSIVAVSRRIAERIDEPRRLLEMVASPFLVATVSACAPGIARPVLIFRQEDLQGRYQAGVELYRRLQVVDGTDAVLELMHPANILAARTYLQLHRYASGVTATATAYGETPSDQGGRVVYGPVSSDEGGAVAYGTQTSAGTDGQTITELVWDRQADNNETPDLC